MLGTMLLAVTLSSAVGAYGRQSELVAGAMQYSRLYPTNPPPGQALAQGTAEQMRNAERDLTMKRQYRDQLRGMSGYIQQQAWQLTFGRPSTTVYFNLLQVQRDLVNVSTSLGSREVDPLACYRVQLAFATALYRHTQSLVKTGRADAAALSFVESQIFLLQNLYKPLFRRMA
jgi:hypothetical protein